MFKRGQILQHDVDFDNAILFAVPVEVWQHGALIDYGGVIQDYNEAAVYIRDGFFLKRVCEFRVR